MSVTLTSSIVATDTLLAITGDTSAASLGEFFAIGDEIVELLDWHVVAEPVGQAAGLAGPNHNQWIVRRGVDGTTPASHGSGVTVYGARRGYSTAVALSVPSPLPGAHTAAEVLNAGTASWYTSGTAAPGTALVSALYQDTTAKHLYVWTGAAYVLVSDYA